MEDEPAPEEDSPLRYSQLQFALRFNGMAQGFLFIVAAMAFDGGVSGRICIQATAAYWIMVAWLAFRRGNALGVVDAMLIRIGFFLWLVIAVVAEGAVRVIFFGGI
jgi:hypothetical protein